MRIVVLFEDQRAAERVGFGPHELLVACLADAIGWERRALIIARLESQPKKGNAGVIDAMKQPRLRKLGAVIGVLDRDQLHTLLKTVRGSCKANERLALQTQLGQPLSEWLEVNFIEQNTETLVEVASNLLKLNPPSKGHADRDRILGTYGISDKARRVERAELLQRVPSFARLVRKVEALLRAELERVRAHP